MLIVLIYTFSSGIFFIYSHLRFKWIVDGCLQTITIKILGYLLIYRMLFCRIQHGDRIWGGPKDWLCEWWWTLCCCYSFCIEVCDRVTKWPSKELRAAIQLLSDSELVFFFGMRGQFLVRLVIHIICYYFFQCSYFVCSPSSVIWSHCDDEIHSARVIVPGDSLLVFRSSDTSTGADGFKASTYQGQTSYCIPPNHNYEFYQSTIPYYN